MLNMFKTFLEERVENEKTITGYLSDVESFIAYIEAEGVKIVQTKETHIKRYNMLLLEEGYSKHTIARKTSALRMFFKFLRRQGLMVYNPIEDIKQPKLEKRETVLEENEKIKLESIIRESGSERDLALFLLATEDKVKMTEAIEASLSSYNSSQGILYLKKKAVSLKSKTREILNLLSSGRENGYLFENQRGEALTSSGVYFIMKKYLEKLGRQDIRPIDLSK